MRHLGRSGLRRPLLVLAAGTVGMLTVGGPAFAASGSARVADPQPLTISGDVPGQLSPGGPPVDVPVKLTNPSAELITLTGLTTTLRSSDLPQGCQSEWFHIVQSDASSASPVDVPASSSVTLPSGGASAPSIQLIDSHTDQDACQHARIRLDYSAQTRSGPATASPSPAAPTPHPAHSTPAAGPTSAPTSPGAPGPAVPHLAWAAPASVAYGTPLTSTQLDPTSSAPGQFGFDPAPGAVLTAGTHTLSASFVPQDPSRYQPATITTTLVVTQAVPTVLWATPPPMPIGTPLSADQLDATASVPGAFAYDPPAGTVLEPGSTRLSVRFTPTDAVDYSTARASVTVRTEGPAAAPAGQQLMVEIDGRPGIRVVEGRVHIVGHGLQSASPASVYAHSTPVLLGTGSADARGDLSMTVKLPAGLGPGGHHIEVHALSASGAPIVRSVAFTVSADDRLASIGRIPKGAYATLVPFEPAAHEALVLRATAGGVAVIGALGAAIGGAGGRVSASGGAREGEGEGGRHEGGGEKEGGSEGAFLADVELERELVHREGHGWGDRSRTWTWRFTRHVDRFSVEYPARLAALSPAIARVSVDGDYLRAMFGGLTLLLYPLAIGCGIAASLSAHGVALPPSFWWFVAILALSIFDSMVGYVAGLSFAATVLLTGGVSSTTNIRELSGIVLVWFAVPLAAGAVRPLRRHVHLRPDSLWDRTADFVIAGLFAGWLTSEMVELLSPLAGYEVPLAERKWTMALVTIGVVGVRIVFETIATHLYPDRLHALRHRGSLEDSSLVQGLFSFAIQISVYVFIATAYMTFDWPLYAGTALFYLPLVPGLFADKLPKSTFVAKWMPAGLTTWTFVIVSGVLLSRLLEHAVTKASTAEKIGFIVEPLPILIIWGLELFAAEGAEDEESAQDEHDEHDEEEAEGEGRFPMTWALRLAGVPAVVLCAYLVLSGVASG